MARHPVPKRGEIWLADIDPTRGHEQAGRRPALVISDDVVNAGPSGLVIVLPVTSRLRKIPSHIIIEPPDGGLRERSAVLCEGIRSITQRRLVTRWGVVSPEAVDAAEDVLRILLSFRFKTSSR